MYFELWQFIDIHCGHFLLNLRWRPDTMSVVIGTKFNMKVYITVYMGAKAVLLLYIHSEISRIIDIKDRYFKIQDGDRVSCQYQFHMDTYRKVYVCQFWFICCKYNLKYACLGNKGDHF